MRRGFSGLILMVMTATSTSSKKARPGELGRRSPAGVGPPRVLVGIRHRAMRELTRKLLERELGWTIDKMGDTEMLVDAIERSGPDAIVIDAGDFPACCQAALDRFPCDRVIVVGPEPDDRHRTIVLAEGAASWVTRERIAEELVAQLRSLLSADFDQHGAGS